MDTLSENPRPLILGVTFVLFVVYAVFSRYTAGRKRIPSEVPWVGLNREEWFSGLRASFRSVQGLAALTNEGYKKFSKADRLFAAPNLLTGPEVLLPHSEMSRVLSMPETVLNVHDVQATGIQQRYTIADEQVMGVTVHQDIIRRQLTRNIGHLTGAIADELAQGFEEQWGTDTENWKEVKVMDTCMKIVARTSNRVFTGAPLCRNQDFLENCTSYATSIVANALIISQLPKWLQPVLGPLFGSTPRRYATRALRHSKPVILERLELNERVRTDPKYAGHELPNDYIQWQIDESYKRNDPVERTPDIINKRVMILNFVAIHTSTMTFSNTIFDLYSADPSEGFIEGIREECDRVLADERGVWSKAAVGQMVRLDSAIKETMRHTPFGLRALSRIVKGEKGMDFGDVNLPHGTRVAFPMQAIHHDPELYPDPLRYDAFRFSRPREEWLAAKPESRRGDAEKSAAGAVESSQAGDDGTKAKANGPEKDLQAILDFKNSSMITVSNDFLSFGHGKHACPGRFFASNEIKMLLAYMIQNYDVEHIPQRPENRTFVDISAPPAESIRVRRRAVPAAVRA